jgi:TonB family protein
MRSLFPEEQIMSHTYGNRGNRKECTTTNSGRMMDVPAVTAFIRPGHGEKSRLLPPILRTPLPMPFVVFLALQAAFFGCIAWIRISAPSPQKALASSAGSGVPALRLADSKTIGSGLGPALVQEVLQLGTADVHVRNRVNAKEHRASSPLAKSTSPTVIAIRPLVSDTASSGLALTNHSVGTANGPVGQTTVEELQPPAVSEVLGAPAGYGTVLAWIADTPVRMPGEPPRIASEVTGGQITHQVTPVYPQQARTQRIQGAVVLEAMIKEDGTVAHVTVLSGGPSSLVNAARQAVQQWRYTPLELNGKPMPMRKEITIKFTLPQN